MDTEQNNPQQWDKKRQQIDQLTANVKRFQNKLAAIKEYAQTLPADIRQQILSILEGPPSSHKPK